MEPFADVVRVAIAERAGPLRGVEPVAGGTNADLTATVTGPAGPMFLKAARRASPDQDGPRVRALRREVAINPALAELAPRPLWSVEAGGWLAVGFEHVQGRHADYSPGSPDLAILTAVVHRLQATPCPVAVEMRVERRWEHLAPDVTPMAGDALLHTDLDPRNLLIRPDRRVHVVDWGFASRGAAWVEIGQIVPWLIHAGHSPAGAERWAARFPSWSNAGAEALDLYVRATVERWTRRAASGPLADLSITRQWAGYRRALRDEALGC